DEPIIKSDSSSGSNIVQSRDKVSLDPKYLSDRIEIDGPLKGKKITNSQSGFDPNSPFKRDMSGIADDIPILGASPSGPGFSARGLGKTPEGAPARKFAENSQIEVRGPDGSVKNYRLGKQIGESGVSSTAYESLDINGNPDGSVIRLSEVEGDRASLFRDLIGRELIDGVGDGSPYFSTSASDGKPDILNIGGDITAISKEKRVDSAASAFSVRNNNKTTGPRKPNKLEELTMQLAIRDLNKRGLTWTDHKLDNFALVPDDKSPTGYRMVIFDTAGIVPTRGMTAADRAANAAEMQRLFDRPTDGSQNPIMVVFQADVSNRIDPTPFGKKFEALGEGQIAITTHGKNRGRDDYFKLAEMTDAELKNYITNDADLPQLLKQRGKRPEDVQVPAVPN
ncbi:MAG: hypothetical protein V7703_20300, partial [Hyphomicrobiales bacterium]